MQKVGNESQGTSIIAQQCVKQMKAGGSLGALRDLGGSLSRMPAPCGVGPVEEATLSLVLNGCCSPRPGTAKREFASEG